LFEKLFERMAMRAADRGLPILCFLGAVRWSYVCQGDDAVCYGQSPQARLRVAGFPAPSRSIGPRGAAHA
jgi:hypothetical protein